jgi:hypothetical protein
MLAQFLPSPQEPAMTRTVSYGHHDLHRLPRFAFPSRGCRDSRREPRRPRQPILAPVSQ